MKNVQSLASIVNNPKKQSVFSTVKTIIKQKIKGGPSPYYKAMKETDIEESTTIPAVKAQKDFRDYKKTLAHKCVPVYNENHHSHSARSSSRNGENIPFQMAASEEKKEIDATELIDS